MLKVKLDFKKCSPTLLQGALDIADHIASAKYTVPKDVQGRLRDSRKRKLDAFNKKK